MAILHCTKKLIEHMNSNVPFIENEPTEVNTTLGNWYANIVIIEARKTIIFTNEKSLLSFFMTGVTKNSHIRVRAALIAGLWALLLSEGVEQETVLSIISEYKDIKFTKTNNKRVLGSMNDLVSMCKYKVKGGGGWNKCDLKKIKAEMNRMPMSYIGYKYAIDFLAPIIKS